MYPSVGRNWGPMSTRKLLAYLGLFVAGGVVLGLLVSGIPRGPAQCGWPMPVWRRPHTEVAFWGARRNWSLNDEWGLVARNQFGHVSGVIELRNLAVNSSFGAAAGLLGYAIVRRYLRGVQPGHCPNCGYDLTGNTSGRCPECGDSITHVAPPSAP